MDSSSKFKSFRKGLQIYKRKKRLTDALGLVAKHLVKCLEDTSVDADKTVDLHTIFDIFTSEFSHLDVPVQKEKILEYLVDNLISNNMVQDALLLTTASYPVYYKVPFLELQMRVHHNQGNMEEFWKTVRDWQVEELIAYAETTYILGTRLMDSGQLQKSIDTLSVGIIRAESDGKQSLVEMMRNMLSKAEKRMKVERELAPHEASPEEAVQIAPREDIQSAAQEATQLPVLQQTAEEAERHAKELLAEEDARIVAESKRKAKKQKKSKRKQISVVKKAVEVEDEWDGKVLEEKKEEKGSGSKLVEERRSRKRKFEMTLYVTMEELDEQSCMGSTKINTTEVRKSFIVAEPSHINNIQELVHLCLTHENLLKIDQSLKTLDEGSLMLLTSEDVCNIQCFFKHKLSKVSPQSQESNEAWWEAIKDVFWKVFRGVIRGLMHLFARGKSCGHLVFSAFVTSKGEGRILPSMEKVKQKQDLIDLVDLMQSVIKLPVPHRSDLSFLPYHLNHFFDLIKKVDWSIPLEFLIDHPYFWNLAEKIDFTFKLRKLVKRKSAPLLSALIEFDYYHKWWDKLIGVYHLLYVEATEHKKVKQYKLRVDIVRYFGAVYTHINEYEYKAARNRKIFTDEKIESDLAKIFPNFYVDMFYCLCMCEGELDYADFMGLSTVLSHV